MREIEQILQLWQQARKSGQPAVLATVVQTQGSSYRLPGARLLLLQDGRRAGSISGGCLEGDLVTKGWWLTEKGPVVRRYDTNSEGEIGTGGFGLGCNGIIHVLVERVTPENPGILEALAEVRATRSPLTVWHGIGPETFVGTRIVRQASATVELGLPESQVFVETLTPPIRLLVFGAGEDAIPLTELASYLGWRTYVYDGRAQYARRNRFPSAERVAIRPLGSADALPIDAWTVAVLMTHSYTQDLDVLRQLAASPTPPRYAGVLGPRKRTSQLLADAQLDFVQLGDALHSPMGLDIGADGPEQVALAVIAEIQAVLNRRTGGLLRDRRGSIHAPDSETEAETEKQSVASGQFRVGSIACA